MIVDTKKSTIIFLCVKIRKRGENNGQTKRWKEYEGRYISVETANVFMETVENIAGKVALAVSMYIVSVIPVIFMGTISEYSGFLSEDMALGISVAIMLTIVAAATVIIIFNQSKLEKYEYIEKEDIIPEYGLNGIIEKKMNEYHNTHGKLIAMGVGLCIA